MTRSDLVAQLAERFAQLTQRDTEFAVKTILDAMSDALARGHRIEIRGFGSFSINRRPPRVGRNPRSGEQVTIPEKLVPHFKPGKALREAVDHALPAEDRSSRAADRSTRSRRGTAAAGSVECALDAHPDLADPRVHLLHAVRVRAQQPARHHRALVLRRAVARPAGDRGAGGVRLGLALGVLAMVPRWWRHRRLAQRQARTPPAPTPAVAEPTTTVPSDIAFAQPPREGL